MITLPTDKNWERLYDVLGARDLFALITSSDIQSSILPIKIVFILFSLFFLGAVIYFYVNSSYLKYQFMQDVSEFFSWNAYGLGEVNKRWKSILKRIETGSEKEYKLAIVEADYFLDNILQDAEFKGSNFEERVQSAGKRILQNWKDILQAHQVRNQIVHDVNYRLDVNIAKKALEDYEKAIKSTYSV